MQGDENGLKIKVTNHLNGEIIEKTIDGADAAVNFLTEIEASERAFKTAKENIKVWIDVWMGQDDKAEAGGKIITRAQTERRSWTIQGLKDIGLDQDAIDVVSKVDMSAAKTLIDEMIDRGEVAPNAKKTLNESADVSYTTPFLRFTRIK